MKRELTGIALTACLAMTNGLQVEAEAEFLDTFFEDLIEDITNHFNPLPAINYRDDVNEPNDNQEQKKKKKEEGSILSLSKREIWHPSI